MIQSELEFLPKAISIYEKGEIMGTKRRHFSATAKVAILRQHLLEQVPISDLCDAHGIQASQYYVWQKLFFEKGTAVFERQQDVTTPLKKQVAELETKLSSKNEVIAELLEEHIKVKKALGDV